MHWQSCVEAEQGAVGDETNKPDVSLERKLADIDLNLLVTLEALLVCRNVTHAAKRIGQTQPVVSRALARLRDILGDDLLVRGSAGPSLTPRGEYLAQIVPVTMLHVRDVISSRQGQAEVRMSINVNLVPTLVPTLLRSAGREKELLKLKTHMTCSEGMSHLRARATQLMLCMGADTCDDLERHTFLSEEFVTLLASEGRHCSSAGLGENCYFDLTHINLIENGKDVFPQAAEMFLGHGVQRSRMLQIPDIRSAAMMVSESELAMTVPRSIAAWLMKTLPLQAFRPPIFIPSQEVAICWLAGAADPDRLELILDMGEAARDAMMEDQRSIEKLGLVRPEA